MRHISKILVLALTLCLLAAIPVHAVEQEEVLQTLALLEVMNGDENGDLHLDRPVTRAQFAKMCVAASPLKDQGKYPSGLSPFPDVPANHWAAGYITAARDAGWFFGDLNGKFRPNDGVTLAEAATVVLRMLGHSNFTGRWPSGQMRLYHTLELDESISAGQNDKLTRLACGRLIYNLLSTPTQSGQIYCVSLGYSLNAQGEIDSLALMEQKLKGPVILKDSLAGAVGFIPRHIYVNGEKGSAAEATPYSVVYYQRAASTVFIYTSRHTGTISAISPSEENPTAVTVAGVTYGLGSSQAAISLSSQGQFHVGDRVTLLMGRKNQVVAVVDDKALNQTIYGVVTAVTKTTYTTADGSNYETGAVEVIASDGLRYRHEADVRNLQAGDLVSVDYGTNGQAVKLLRTKTIFGTVGRETIGNRPLSDDIEILDVWEDTAIPVSPERLWGCTLSESDVRYVVWDNNGAITHLILDDYTGDIHRYGLVTKAETIPTGPMTFLCMYHVLLDGQETVLSFENLSFPIEDGGLALRFKGGTPSELVSLERISVDSAGSTWISTDDQRHTLADEVQVYIDENNRWYRSSWAQVGDPDRYSLTAWYDKEDTQGGRVRVITATARRTA